MGVTDFRPRVPVIFGDRDIAFGRPSRMGYTEPDVEHPGKYYGRHSLRVDAAERACRVIMMRRVSNYNSLHIVR